jgi:hypothetical protein
MAKNPEGILPQSECSGQIGNRILPQVAYFLPQVSLSVNAVHPFEQLAFLQAAERVLCEVIEANIVSALGRSLSPFFRIFETIATFFL